MNDLSVINSQNLQATLESRIKFAKETGHTVLVERLSGIVTIGEIRAYKSASEARAAAVGLPGEWYIA